MNPFEVISTPIDGCFEIKAMLSMAERGRLIKIFHQEMFNGHNLNSCYEEQYYSVSTKGVLRGLHFQTAPQAHIKLVSCIAGSILDVVVDLRKDSPTFKKVFSLELSEENCNMLYVPEGLAHGFYVQSSSCIFLSMNSRKYSSECDSAIHWNSINFNWPVANPVVSEKDKNAITLNKYLELS